MPGPNRLLVMVAARGAGSPGDAWSEAYAQAAAERAARWPALTMENVGAASKWQADRMLEILGWDEVDEDRALGVWP